MTIATDTAERVFRVAAQNPPQSKIGSSWVRKIEHLSQLCAEGKSATHIAFLGTTILARAVDPDVDLRAIKPTHSAGNLNAYSARSLCHSVLVPVAAELGVNLGVSGREPLNNQPYFRMTALGDGTPVREKARPAFDYLSTLVDELQSYSVGKARIALSAFIAVRRRYLVVYATHAGETSMTWLTLGAAIEALVQEDSEGGKRAQAVAAGMFDVIAGDGRVESGRINDPSRHYPGDVAVRGQDGAWAKAIEVRDKPVKDSDVYLFCRSCLQRGVRDAAVVLASVKQRPLDDHALAAWAADAGLGLTMFYGWRDFVDQALFWAEGTKRDAALRAVSCIEARLIAVEASAAAVATWQTLTRSHLRSNGDFAE